MKRPLTALFLALLVTACGGSDDDKETLNRTPQANDRFVTLEATIIDPAQPSAASWFKGTYLTKLSTAPGVVATHHYNSLGGPPPFPFPGQPTDLSTFHFSDAASQTGFSTSAPATEAATTLAATPGVTKVSRSLYTLAKSADNGNSTGALPNVTIIGLVIDAAVEAQVLEWEDNKHVPLLMNYKGIAKIVRYQKAAGGSDDAALPKYLEFYYYPNQAASDGQNTDKNFVDAEADRMKTWTDAQLSVNPIVTGTLVP